MKLNFSRNAGLKMLGAFSISAGGLWFIFVDTIIVISKDNGKNTKLFL